MRMRGVEVQGGVMVGERVEGKGERGRVVEGQARVKADPLDLMGGPREGVGLGRVVQKGAEGNRTARARIVSDQGRMG